MSNKIRAAKGSISLEAAIAISLLLIFVSVLLSALLIQQTQTAVATALDNTAAEISLLIPLGEAILENSEQLVEKSTELKELMQDPTGNQLIDAFISDYAPDIFSSMILGSLLEMRCRYWLEDAAASQKIVLKQLNSLKIHTDWQLEQNALILEADMTFLTLVGKVHKSKTSSVPLWLGHRRSSEGSQEEQGENVWSLDNFSRGRILRERFGANLPFNFPVIAKFSGGQATLIRSLDLTAPSYSNANKAIASAASDLDRLASFNGYKGSNQNFPQINANDITSREYLLIIPANSAQELEQLVTSELKVLADAANINLTIVSYQASEKYQADNS